MAYDNSTLGRLKRREASIKATLIRELEWLSRDLQKAAEYLKNDALPNSMGAVQGRGSEIDCLCARLAELRDQREYMEAEAEQKEAEHGERGERG